MQQGLTAIARNYGTDKGALENGYTIVYDLLLAPMRRSPVNLMEIGLSRGGPEVGYSADRPVFDIPSVRMWHDFLPHAHIYGVDISDFSEFTTDWFTFLPADCGSAEELRTIAEKSVEFDVIVDDGSHASFHQQLTLIEFFKCLKPGGLFIIEDLTWQPAEYEQTLPRTPKTADVLFELFEFGHSPHVPEEISSQIASLLIFDEDELIRMRQRYNLLAKDRPRWGHYADGTSTGTPHVRSHLRRIYESLQSVVDTTMGRRRAPPRTKLAVIQKAFNS
jgi:SAM-dependent methyltransferase